MHWRGYFFFFCSASIAFTSYVTSMKPQFDCMHVVIIQRKKNNNNTQASKQRQITNNEPNENL